MPSIKEIPVFCSYFSKHANEYLKYVKAYKNAILCVQNSNFFEENPMHSEEEIKKKIHTLIDLADVFLVLIDSTIFGYPLMDYEISYAAGNNKIIIGIIMPGTRATSIPTIFSDLRFNKYEHVSLIKGSMASLASAIQGTNCWEADLS